MDVFPVDFLYSILTDSCVVGRQADAVALPLSLHLSASQLVHSPKGRGGGGREHRLSDAFDSRKLLYINPCEPKAPYNPRFPD